MPAYTCFFSDGGAGKTGLTPTVTWRNADGTSAGTAPTVTELDSANAPGWYIFDASPLERVVVTVDAGVDLADDSRLRSFEIAPEDFQGQAEAESVRQRWDSIRAVFVATNGGDAPAYGASGLSVVVRRDSDGLLYDGLGGWGALIPFGEYMTQPDASNFPGVWEYALPGGALSEDETGYTVKIIGPDFVAYQRIEVVQPVAGDVWGATATDYATSGSMGMLLRLTAGLAHNNFRIKNPEYSGSRMTSCDLVVYPTAADAAADTNALATIAVTCTYDANGNLSTYLGEGTA